MVNDNERREVARRLRGLRPGACFDDVYEALGAYGPNPYASRVLSATEFARLLADLIEPPACPSRAVRAYAEEVDWHTGESPFVHELRGIADRMDRECAPVDREALLALAEELKEDACWEVQTPGDTSGAWRLKDVCDRIREALGVSDDA